MLPNANHGPAASAQSAVYAAVASLVAGDLGQPECRAGCRPSGVLGAAVPEASIHKHRGLQLGENEVWFAGQFRSPSPADDATRTENLNQPQLGVLVARSTDAGHHC